MLGMMNLKIPKETTPHPQKDHDISPLKQNCPSSLEKTQPVEPPVEDADGDGFLYSTELKNFAAEMGFEGNDSEWNQEKKSTNPPFCWVKLGQVLRFLPGGLGVGGEICKFKLCI